MWLVGDAFSLYNVDENIFTHPLIFLLRVLTKYMMKIILSIHFLVEINFQFIIKVYGNQKI